MSRDAEVWDGKGPTKVAGLVRALEQTMVGATRETVTLLLGQLRRAGVIEFDRRRIVVLDHDALVSRGSQEALRTRGGR